VESTCVIVAEAAGFGDGKHFTQALGLTPPWLVESFNFSVDDGRIDFVVVFHTKRLTCPGCGAVEPPVHDRIERTWRHLNYFQFKAFIRACEGNQCKGSMGRCVPLGD